jgi:hypothetical protein
MLLKSSQSILKEFLKCSPFVTFQVLGIGAFYEQLIHETVHD